MSNAGAAAFGDDLTVRGLAEGQRHFGRFVLVRPLGRGGMGVVWLARDESLGEEVALKFLPAIMRWDPAALAELKAETRRARLLTHPGIVRIHDFVEDASGAAIAMEAINGRTLAEERLARPAQVLEPAEIAPWIGQLTAALDYAHSEVQIAHRDLKPSNVMLTLTGRIKVADFGVARAMGETMLRVSQLATGGTLLYMSPQQAMGEPPTSRDDIYALGATLYELLTGKPPFHSGNVAAQIERRKPDSLAARRRQLGVSAGAVPRAWEETIAACLAKQPEDRPASAGEVAARLTRMSGPMPGWRRVTRRRGMLAALTLVLVTASVGGVGWAWQRGRSHANASGLSAGAAAFPSDGTRAWAAWNLDGDGADASGRGMDLKMAGVLPAVDRFGRIDRALFFNGAAALGREGLAPAGWGASEPFSVALWVRPESAAFRRGGGVLAGMRSERQGDFFWQLEIAERTVGLHVGRSQIDGPDQALVAAVVPAGRWTHIAAVSDGEALRIYLDGRERAREPIRRNRGARFTAAAILTVAHGHKFDLEKFAGAMDELRLWQRALTADEIVRLATHEAPPRFVQTVGGYSARDDLPAAVRREFGPEAELADWQELKRWHADDVEAWSEELSLVAGQGSPLVQNEQRRHAESTRHYFLNRFDGRKPDYFRAHDELGGMRLALGSWFDIKARVLARLPHRAPVTETITALPGGEIVADFPLPAGRPLAAWALAWRGELAREGTPRMRVELRLRDGRVWVVDCAPAAQGMFALAVGPAERPRVSRQFRGAFGPAEFAVVLRRGKLQVRVVNSVGADQMVGEEVELDFALGEIVQVALRGVDSAELTRED